MQWTKSLALTLALGIGAPMFAVSAFAEDKPAETKPEAKPDAKKEVKGPRLWGQWAKLKSLTPEQKVKLDEIHKKALAEKKKIDDQEETDITALLTDEQKLEVQALKEEEAAKRKAGAAEKVKPEPKKEEEKKNDGM